MRSRVNALNKSKTPTADLFLASPYFLFAGFDLVTLMLVIGERDGDAKREKKGILERERKNIRLY